VDSHSYERALRPLLSQAAAYSRALLRNTHDAEDAVQQTALRAWERIAHYDHDRPFKGWWFAVLRNCCFDILRLKRSSRTQSIEGIDLVDDAATEAPAEVVDWQSLDDAIAKLTEPHREILRLKYFGELKYDELAIALGIPRGTVMSRLHLARKALAALMPQEKV
jgi:RNA polymerase sigma-70 factor (ECF subfamily)